MSVVSVFGWTVSSRTVQQVALLTFVTCLQTLLVLTLGVAFRETKL